MLSRWIIAAAIAVPLLPAMAQQQGANAQAAAPKAAPAVRISQDKIDSIRRSVLSQIAVYDAAEQAMRRPTEAEAGALASSATESTAAPIALRGGGLALRRDLSSASFLIVDLGADGKKSMRHGIAQSVAPAAKGGQDAR